MSNLEIDESREVCCKQLGDLVKDICTHVTRSFRPDAGSEDSVGKLYSLINVLSGCSVTVRKNVSIGRVLDLDPSGMTIQYLSGK